MRCAKEWLPLYAVTDRSWLDGRTFHEVAEAALRGGVTCLQLREKELEHESFLREAISLKELCDKYQVPLIIDDEVGIAIESRAAGVHIGQQDEPAAEVRRRLGPNMLLGVSAQTVEQAVKAEREGADYLGVGAVFPTGTKLDAEDAPAEIVHINCSGASKAEVNAVKQLWAQASGASKITYSGKPVVKKKMAVGASKIARD